MRNAAGSVLSAIIEPTAVLCVLLLHCSNLTKDELLTPKSFIGGDAHRPADILAADRV
jgi:hypothetical protein